MTTKNEKKEDNKKEDIDKELEPYTYTGELNFNKKVEVAGSHIWRQQGVYVICKSCPMTHAIYIGIDKMLVGIDEKGLPLVAKRK